MFTYAGPWRLCTCPLPRRYRHRCAATRTRTRTRRWWVGGIVSEEESSRCGQPPGLSRCAIVIEVLEMDNDSRAATDTTDKTDTTASEPETCIIPGAHSTTLAVDRTQRCCVGDRSCAASTARDRPLNVTWFRDRASACRSCHFLGERDDKIDCLTG